MQNMATEAGNLTPNSALSNSVHPAEKIAPPPPRLSSDELRASDTDMHADHTLTEPHPSAPASQRHPQWPGAGRQSGGRASSNAARERSRVKTLRAAFLELQRTLPAVPKDTKLSKLDVLVLATTYIAHLTTTLARSSDNAGTEGRHPHHHHETSVIPDSHQHSGKVSEAWRDRHYRPTPADTVSWSQTGPCRTGDGSGDGTGLTSPRELSQCGGSGRGVKDHHGRVSGLRSHGYLHPVKKWPMRTRLYAGIMASACGIRKNTSPFSSN